MKKRKPLLNGIFTIDGKRFFVSSSSNAFQSLSNFSSDGLGSSDFLEKQNKDHQPERKSSLTLSLPKCSTATLAHWQQVSRRVSCSSVEHLATDVWNNRQSSISSMPSRRTKRWYWSQTIDWKHERRGNIRECSQRIARRCVSLRRWLELRRWSSWLLSFDGVYLNPNKAKNPSLSSQRTHEKECPIEPSEWRCWQGHGDVTFRSSVFGFVESKVRKRQSDQSTRLLPLRPGNTQTQTYRLIDSLVASTRAQARCPITRLLTRLAKNKCVDIKHARCHSKPTKR